MWKLMEGINSKRSSNAKVKSLFAKLEKLVTSHVAAEEKALFNVTIENPKFEDESREGIEEHEIHKGVLAAVGAVTDEKRKITRMRIFCEMLEAHLDEEQKDIFPKFKKYAALSTRKKMGATFLKSRKATHRKGETLGALGDVK